MTENKGMNAFWGKGVFSLLDLLVIMLERVGMIVAVAFILNSDSAFFKNLVQRDKLNRKQDVHRDFIFRLIWHCRNVFRRRIQYGYIAF